jgi:hypothetical protein
MTGERIISLLNSLLPIVITLVFAWLSSRNDETKRRQLVEDAKQRIELISAYVTSQTLVIDDPNELGEIKKTVANELYEIKAFLDHTLQSLDQTSEKSEDFFRRFFLLYKMNTRLASFLRVIFFIILFVSVIWSIIVPSFMFTPLPDQETGPDDTVINLIGTVVLVLPVVLVAMMVRWLAIKFDKPVNDSVEGGLYA